MPSGRRTTLPAPQMPTEGTLTMAKSAGQVLALGITRQLLAEDLEPIATPVLLRRLLGRRSVSGTLRIRSSQLDIDVDIEAGNAMMTRGEHTAFMHVFEIEKGRWELVAERSQASQRELYPLPRLALEGVRRLLRLIPHQEMSEALGERNALAPKLVAEHATLPRRLGLSGRERRFVTEYVDGRASARALSRSVIVGASTCYQILALLELFGALAWLEPSSANPGTPVSPAGEPDGPPDSTP
jgi:hypothetical protein